MGSPHPPSRTEVQQVFVRVFRMLGGSNAASLRLDQLLALLAESMHLQHSQAWLCSQGTLAGTLDRLLDVRGAISPEELLQQVERCLAGADPGNREHMLALLRDLMGVRAAPPREKFAADVTGKFEIEVPTVGPQLGQYREESVELLADPMPRRTDDSIEPIAAPISQYREASVETQLPPAPVSDPQAIGPRSVLADQFLQVDCERIPLRDLLSVREDLSRIINRRFKTKGALVFTDMVDSTQYYRKFGDEAGQALMQRQMQLLQRVLDLSGGFLVHQTGDGAFCFIPGLAEATQGMVDLAKLVMRDNRDAPADAQLRMRIGIHVGEVLRDGELVTGDSVNVAARITTLASDGQIAMTHSAYSQLPGHLRLPCRKLPPAHLKGIEDPVEVLLLDWQDRVTFPTRVLITETGQEHVLPDLDVISFGRMIATERIRGNNIVLTHPDAAANLKISRWHFTLHRHPTGFQLCALTEKATVVNGVPVEKGAEVPIHVGCVVEVAGVLNLHFVGDPSTEPENVDATVTGKFYSPYAASKKTQL